jgi:hypothetical protein
MGLLVFLVLVVMAWPHLSQAPRSQGRAAAVVALELLALVAAALEALVVAVLAAKQSARTVQQEQLTQVLVAAAVQRLREVAVLAALVLWQ